MEDQTRPEQYV